MYLQNRESRGVWANHFLGIGRTTCSFVMHLYLEDKLVSACAALYSCSSCSIIDYFLIFSAVCLTSVLFGISWDTALDQATIYLPLRRIIPVAFFSAIILWLLTSYIANCRTENSKNALDEALFFLALFHVIPPLCNSVGALHVKCVTSSRNACSGSWQSNLSNIMLIAAPLIIWQDDQCTWIHLFVGTAFLIGLTIISFLLSGPWNTSHSWARIIIFAGNLLISAWIQHACSFSTPRHPGCKFHAITAHAPVTSHTVAKLNFFSEEKSHNVIIWNFSNKLLPALRWVANFAWYPLWSLLFLSSKTLLYHESGSQENSRPKIQDEGDESSTLFFPAVDAQPRTDRSARYRVPHASTSRQHVFRPERPLLCSAESTDTSDSDHDAASRGEPAPDLLPDSTDDCAATASAAPTRPGSHETGPAGAALRISSHALSIRLETGGSQGSRADSRPEAGRPAHVGGPGLGLQPSHRPVASEPAAPCRRTTAGGGPAEEEQPHDEPAPRREPPHAGTARRAPRTPRPANDVAHGSGDAGSPTQVQQGALRQCVAASGSTSRARSAAVALSAEPSRATGAGGVTGPSDASHGDTRPGTKSSRRPGRSNHEPGRAGHDSGRGMARSLVSGEPGQAEPRRPAWERPAWALGPRDDRLAEAEAEAEAEVWDTCTAEWESDADLGRWARATLPTRPF